MYRGKQIALVIPAYREQRLIGATLAGVPALFDRIYVVDDASPDGQQDAILRCGGKDPRIHLIRHTINQGPGGAIITGYRQAARDGMDITVVVGGDNQMNLGEVQNFLDPIVDGRADYTKGNRFLIEKLEDTIKRMPRLRFFANWLITAVTKVASGYFRIMDVVDGYTAISREAIERIDWNQAWKGYGYPMDFLIRLNAYEFRVLDVPRSAIYLPGERQSQIKGAQYALRVSPMLLRGFLWRIRFKYIYLNFHPLVFFYYLAFLLLPAGLILGGFLVFDKLFLEGYSVTAPRAVLVALLLTTGAQFLLFAMLFDREESKWDSRPNSRSWSSTSLPRTTPASASLTL